MISRDTLTPAIQMKRLGLALVALTLAGAGAAHADCNADFAALMTKRVAQIGALNKISKAHGGKLDPIEGCPRLRELAAAEGQVVAYMSKNKDWCNIPDQMVEQMTATHSRTVGFAAKACAFAVKMKEMQSQQQQQAQSQQQEQAIKLPTGPL